MTKVNLELISKVKIKNPTVLIGFQGIGLVGMLAAQHLSKELKCELIGHIESDQIPPLAILHENEITFPIRLSYDKKNNIVVIESEIPVTPEMAYEIGHVIINYIKKVGAKQVYILEGLVSNELPDETKVFGIPTNEVMRKVLKKNDVSLISSGAILGIAGALLLCSKESNINSAAIMAESHVNIPDAMAASNIVKKIAKIIGVKVDVEHLRSKGKQTEEKIKSVLEHMKKFKTSEDSKILYG